jgi:hypothetical protein
MKRILALALALASFGRLSADPAPAAPIVIAPVTSTVHGPQHVTLSAAQVAALTASLSGQGITFNDAAGKVSRIIVALQPDGSASVTVTFAQ